MATSDWNLFPEPMSVRRWARTSVGIVPMSCILPADNAEIYPNIARNAQAYIWREQA